MNRVIEIDHRKPDADAPLSELAALGTVRHFRKHATLITEGDEGHSLYLILDGRVKVFASDHEGKECVFDTFGPGAMVGEMSLDGQPRTASVVTLVPTTCAVVSFDALRNRIKSDAEFAFSLILMLIQRGRKATDFARRLALESAYERLCGLLNQLSVVESDQSCVIAEEFSQQDLAERIGASRDMVSKIFRELSKGGYLNYQKRRIVLLKPLPPRW